VDLSTMRRCCRGPSTAAICPQNHAIRKADGMYYAFFAPDFKGKVELRGLEHRSYTVRDYENGRDLGTVRGPAGSLNVQFAKHLLLEAKPQ